MKIYEVVAVKLTCDGFRAGDEVLKRYTNEDDAESLKRIGKHCGKRILIITIVLHLVGMIM